MRENEASEVGGFSANRLVIPLAVIIAILHIVIISLVYETNRANNEFSVLTRNYSEYQQNATNIQAGSSTLSETATSFIQVPIAGGEFNTGPLMRYAQELDRGRDSQQIAEWFRSQNVTKEVQDYIDAAAMNAQEMFEKQIHAIALICSIYPKPPIPALSTIPDVPLTEEELAMPDEARQNYARGLILSQEYSMIKASLADNIENSHRLIQQNYSQAESKCENYINTLRIWLWVVIFAIIFLLLCTFALFYRWLVMPLRIYAKQITSDQSMNQASHIREMRLVVNAYNLLLKRHDKLESILRSAAETDALTDLQNRYSLEHFVLEIGEAGGPLAVLLFDVNYLKRTNDTDGHSAGDRLLRTAGACICECFESEGTGQCYRIGGDEFAAVLRGCTEEEVKTKIDRFNLVLERENISVSVGYAYTENANENSFDELFKKADERMYEQKKLTHERDHIACRSEINSSPTV